MPIEGTIHIRSHSILLSNCQCKIWSIRFNPCDPILPTVCDETCHVSTPLGCDEQRMEGFLPGQIVPFRRDPVCDLKFEGIGLPGVEESKSCVCREGFYRDDADELEEQLGFNFETGMCLKLAVCEEEGCAVESDGIIIGVRVMLLISLLS